MSVTFTIECTVAGKARHITCQQHDLDDAVERLADTRAISGAAVVLTRVLRFRDGVAEAELTVLAGLLLDAAVTQALAEAHQNDPNNWPLYRLIQRS